MKSRHEREPMNAWNTRVNPAGIKMLMNSKRFAISSVMIIETAAATESDHAHGLSLRLTWVCAQSARM